MGIWAIRNPLKIHCYTCMSFKTCWSRLIYTKLSSHQTFVINMYVVTMAWRCISPWRNLEIDCDEIPVPFALLQGYWVVQNLHFLMVFAQGVQIANEATGFYMYYCRWQVAISALRFSVFTSVQSMFSSFFFWLFLLQKAEMCWHPFIVFLGATDGNFTGKYSVTPSWQRTCLWQMTGVRIVSWRSADFNMFEMTYQCIFTGFRIAQIPTKEGAALGIWMICTRFEVYVCSYVE